METLTLAQQAWLKEIEEFLDDQQDVVDGSDGPRPNRAMQLLTEMERVGLK